MLPTTKKSQPVSVNYDLFISALQQSVAVGTVRGIVRVFAGNCDIHITSHVAMSVSVYQCPSSPMAKVLASRLEDAFKCDGTHTYGTHMYIHAVQYTERGVNLSSQVDKLRTGSQKLAAVIIYEQSSAEFSQRLDASVCPPLCVLASFGIPNTFQEPPDATQRRVTSRPTL